MRTSSVIPASPQLPQPQQAEPHARPAPLADAATKPGTVTTETLPNGVRLVIASRPGAAATKFQIGIGAGSLQDPEGKLGLAHMLEHLSFEGSPTRSAPKQEALRSKFGDRWNAWTNQSEVVFWGIIPNKDAEEGAALVTDMFQHAATSGPRVPQERAAVQNEMVYHGGTLASQQDDMAIRLLYGDSRATNNVIGTRPSVTRITTKDLKDFHSRYFVGDNTVALIDGNPSAAALDTFRKELGELPAGARVDNSSIKAELQKGQSLQVINDPSSGTVALDVLVPIEGGAEKVSTPEARLLVSALSQRLNDKARRNDHLTYGVSATFEPSEGTQADQQLLRVQTTVAGDYSREALEDIVSVLKGAQDGFGPKTFLRDRAQLAAHVLSGEPPTAPTTSDIADAAFTNALYTPGVTIPEADAGPGLRAQSNAIERVTPESYLATSKELINLDNLKVLAIGDLGDGGGQLLAGMRDAGVDTSKLALNPLNLSTYKDMGIGVPRNVTPPVKPAR
jgi:predicted Zn-dependent peptidase